MIGGFVACGGSTTSKSGGSVGVAVDTGGPPPPADLDKSPIDTSTMTPMAWSWLPVQGAVCRDGSPTGIGLNLNPASKDLVIYLEGGGACFNALTCSTNPKCFDPPGSSSCLLSYDTRLGTSASGHDGLFNRTDPGNPVKDWNYMYVPFCTGDVHAGNFPDQMVPGVTGAQQFVGYVNMTRFLARIAPTFKDATKVLLTGISAGGFGAAANYPQTARAFPNIPVYDLDDSGPPMEDPYAASCLQKEWATLWGFDKTIFADCGTDCPDHTDYTIDATIHTARLFPHIPFGLVEDTDDSVITLFYGFGANSCAAAIIPTPLTGPVFTKGLLDSRAKLAAAGVSNVGGFVFQGTAHTSLGGSSTYDSVTAGSEGGTTKLSDWVTTLVNDGKVANVGP
jgi:hypothetical protein